MGKNNQVIFFAAGVGVGAAVAVFMASERGRKARQYLADMTGPASDALNRGAKTLGEAAGSVIEDVSHTAKKAARKFVDESRELAYSADKKLDEGVKQFK